MIKFFSIFALILFTSTAASGSERFMYQYFNCGVHKKGKLASAPCMEKTSAKYCKMFDDLPKDVQDFVELGERCNFLAGEQSGDEERDEKIIEGTIEMGCGVKNSDEVRAALIKKYKSQPKLVETAESLQNDYDKEYKQTCYGRK